MARAEHIPEAADGGWWYVVEAISTGDGWTVPDVPGSGWCAWYGEVDGVMYAAIRCPDPVIGLPTASIPVQQVLEAAGYETKPYGRVGGK